MRIRNLTQGTIIAENAILADSFFGRIKGLLGKKRLAFGEALIIKPCNSIHTFFMAFSIDAIFVDRNNKVVGLVKRLKPFQISPIFFKAWFVIELPEGTITKTRTRIEEVLAIED